MFNKTLALAAIGLLLFQNVMAFSIKDAADAQFEKLANKYVVELMAMNPERATGLGEHKYDYRLDDYTLEGVKKDRDFTQKYLNDLNKISFDKLSKINNVDARIFRENLEYGIFQIDVLRGYEWNPINYNVGGAINGLISRDFAPLKERLTSAKGRLEAIPNVVAAAKRNLKNPPRIYTETAIAQNKGVIGLINGDLQMFIDRAGMKAELAPAQATAIAALTDYGVWLETDLLPRSNGDFRLGEAKYRQKLKFALSSEISKEELLKRAEADLKATQDKMLVVAFKIMRGMKEVKPIIAREDEGKRKTIKYILDELAKKHPTNENIVSQASGDLQETTEFVRKNNLVTVPTEPVKVIEMP